MKVNAWLIDFAHFRENCPTGIIPEWLNITGLLLFFIHFSDAVAVDGPYNLPACFLRLGDAIVFLERKKRKKIETRNVFSAPKNSPGKRPPRAGWFFWESRMIWAWSPSPTAPSHPEFSPGQNLHALTGGRRRVSSPARGSHRGPSNSGRPKPRRRNIYCPLRQKKRFCEEKKVKLPERKIGKEIFLLKNDKIFFPFNSERFKSLGRNTARFHHRKL